MFSFFVFKCSCKKKRVNVKIAKLFCIYKKMSCSPGTSMITGDQIISRNIHDYMSFPLKNWLQAGMFLVFLLIEFSGWLMNAFKEVWKISSMRELLEHLSKPVSASESSSRDHLSERFSKRIETSESRPRVLSSEPISASEFSSRDYLSERFSKRIEASDDECSSFE